MSTQVILPRLMQVGAEAAAQLPEVLASLGCNRPLIITDPMMVKLGYVDQIRQLLEQQQFPVDVFADTVPEPTVSSIQAGVERVRQASSIVWSPLAEAARSIAPKPLAFSAAMVARCGTTASHVR